jgi:hypothetical protein
LKPVIVDYFDGNILLLVELFEKKYNIKIEAAVERFVPDNDLTGITADYKSLDKQQISPSLSDNNTSLIFQQRDFNIRVLGKPGPSGIFTTFDGLKSFANYIAHSYYKNNLTVFNPHLEYSDLISPENGSNHNLGGFLKSNLVSSPYIRGGTGSIIIIIPEINIHLVFCCPKLFYINASKANDTFMNMIGNVYFKLLSINKS